MTDSLDALKGCLGVKGAVNLLVFALPLIGERRKMLQQHLQAADWDAALRVAHQTLGSVRVYGSSRMEYLLQQVRQQEIGAISSTGFQLELDQAFEVTAQALQKWLDEHPL